MITISAFKWVPPFARGQVRDLRARWACEEAGIAYKTKLIGFFLCNGETYKPSTILCHKIYYFSAAKFCSNHKVSLIFSILVINKDYHPSISYFFNSLFYRASSHF